MAFRYIVTSILSSRPIGELFLSNVTWTDPVFGTGGSFEAKAQIGVPRGQDRDALMLLTQPDAVALYVQDDETGQYLFGGPLYDTPWDRSSRALSIKAQSWKSWLYQKFCQMNTATNPVTDIVYKWTAKDQFLIAQQLIAQTVNVDVGCPTIKLTTDLSGVNRDLTVRGSDMKAVAAVIDTMANRDNGFEWDVQIRSSNAGYPEPWFIPYFPIRGGLNNQIILFHAQDTGGNILVVGNPDDSAANRRSRIWATGSGTPPDQVIAFDQDPNLSVGGFILLREQASGYNDVTKVTTLADHARSQRNYQNSTLSQVTLEVKLDDPHFRSYNAGDKIRLLVQDEWIDWDFDAVRIVRRDFAVGAPDMIDRVKLVIDLNDTALPENVAVV